MKEQNYSNHRQFVPLYHYVTFGLVVILLLFSLYYLIRCINNHLNNIFIASMLFIIALILLFMFFYLRIFSLKAQDRAIRAEENLRHYVLTGKLLDPRLNIGQVIALRFAPDDEFVELCSKSASEGMKSDDIKKAIKNWRADHHRA